MTSAPPPVEPVSEKRDEGRGRPPSCLVQLPARTGDALGLRGLLSSLAATGRQLIVLTRGEQSAILDPTLLDLRLRHTPGHLEAPISAAVEDVDARRLRSFACREAILLEPGWWASRATAAGIASRRGPGGGLFGVFLTDRLERRLRGHPEDAAEGWARDLEVPWRPMPTLHVGETWRRVGRERLRKAKLDLDVPKIGLYLGGDGGLGPTWPAEKMEELARRLRRRHPAARLVILSTEAELWQSVLLYERTGKIHPVIGPDLETDGLAAVLLHLDLVVAADSAILHLAAALGTPTLGLYQRHALRHAPRGEGASHLQRAPLKKLEIDDVLERCELP